AAEEAESVDLDGCVPDVGEPNQPPEFAPHPSRITIREGRPLHLGVAATDPDEDDVTLAFDAEGSELPDGARIVFKPAFGALRWTPGFDDARDQPYVLVFLASDGRGGEASITIEVLVVEAEAPPAEGVLPETPGCD